MAGHTPNFFIVGAAKSGTTSVARYLAEHPQVFMSPIKEPSYFARDIIPDLQPPNWRGGCVLEWEAYLKLFRNVAGESAIGDASTGLSDFSKGAVRHPIGCAPCPHHHGAA
jgi:hypothetical protein